MSEEPKLPQSQEECGDFSDISRCKNCNKSKIEGGKYYCKARNEETTAETHCAQFVFDLKKVQTGIKRKWKKEEKKDKLEQIKKNDKLNIWIMDEKGNAKLDHRAIANLLIEKFYFITTGTEKKEIHFFDGKIYSNGGEKIIGSETEKITNSCVKNNDINEIVGHIQRMTYQDKNIFNSPDQNLICVENGILNINKLELQPHTPEIKFMQKIPIKFDPNVKCEKINKFLNEILKAEDIPVIQEFFGYLFYREYFVKRAVIFVGEPHTGKTTLIKLMVAFIGEKNTSGVSLHKLLYNTFAAANLQNKLLNFYDDLSFRDIKETGQFKIATGTGYLAAEKKFGECFEFLNYAKLLFATNKICAVEDADDDAYYDRWMIIFFNNIFDDDNVNTDKRIIQKLTTEEELSGLLNWALEGLKRVLKNNKFSYLKTTEENRLIMERSSNTMAAFVQDCIVENPGKWLSKEDMYFLYSEYVNKFGGARITKEKFGRDLMNKAPFIIDGRKDTEKKASVHGWLNVGINTTFTPFLDIICVKNKKYTIPLNNDDIDTFFRAISCNKEVNVVSPTLEAFQKSEKPILESEEVIDEKPMQVQKETLPENDVSSEEVIWDEKSLAWHQCAFPAGDTICSDSPCNEFEGFFYCKKHFEEVQK